jgi:hypothetical protein
MLDGTVQQPDIALARVHGVAAIERLVQILDGPDAAVSVRAAEVLLNRGFGLPVQQVVFDEGGIAISVEAANGEGRAKWGAS